MSKMTKRARLRRLEERVDTLEAKLTGRDWSTLPPPPYVPIDDLPSMPDFSAGGFDTDDEWNPTGYL